MPISCDEKEMVLALGRVIRASRIAKGYSQEQLAERAGLHRTYVGMVERGERNITIVNYIRVARSLGMSVTELIASSSSSKGGELL
jgi:transcriptional regulator with XRE-family HTH domain